MTQRELEQEFKCLQGEFQKLKWQLENYGSSSIVDTYEKLLESTFKNKVPRWITVKIDETHGDYLNALYYFNGEGLDWVASTRDGIEQPIVTN